MTHWGQHSSPTTPGSSDTSGASGQTVGFRYFMGMHMGLCRGPIDELIEIRVGDRTAWSASLGVTSDFLIDAYDLFGGESSEGGIKGTATLMMGDANQICPSSLIALLDNISANIGTVSADTIAIDNQTIEGYDGDSYVGIKTDDLGYIYATHSSGPDVKLDRPWTLNAPLYNPNAFQPGKFSPAQAWNIRYHLEEGGTIPFTDSAMKFDIFYSMGKVREMRLVAPGTATFLITIQTSSGVTLDTAAVTLHLH